MTLADFIVVVVLILILSAALAYIKKEKQRGVACIGCPDAEVCAKRRNGETCKSTDNEK